MEVTFKVYRKDPEKDGKPGRSNYTLDLPEDATVLDALLKIRDETDSTLAFRASCGRGYCGECMMRVNGSARLSCTAKVPDYQEGARNFTRPAAQRPCHQGPRFRLGRLHVEQDQTGQAMAGI